MYYFWLTTQICPVRVQQRSTASLLEPVELQSFNNGTFKVDRSIPDKKKK